MKLNQKTSRHVLAILAVTALITMTALQTAQASGGSGGGGNGGGGGGSTAPKPVVPVDDIGGSVKSGGGGGGGGKKSTTPAPAPAPAPAPVPVVTATVTYSASGPSNGVVPVCTGSYQIDPYYPTLLDMTMNVQVSSMNVPDGTVLYVDVVGSTTLYPYTSNAIVVVGGSGSCSEKIFIVPGATVAGVLVSDAVGNVIFAGN